MSIIIMAELVMACTSGFWLVCAVLLNVTIYWPTLPVTFQLYKNKFFSGSEITNHTRGSSTTYVMIYELLVEWVYNQNTEDGEYFLPWCRHILSISLDTGWGIGTEIC